jgi:pyruvate formate lyase activating enzyme
MSVAEVLSEIERDVVFYDETGGGATFSGGEPLLQPTFLMALLEACRERRIHTAIETCGAAPSETLLRAARTANLVLYDLKLVDAAKHQRYTGASNRLILDNLARLSAERLPVVVRIPVVPGVNDAPQDIDAFARFLAPLNVQAVSLLPYHATGADKYRRLGIQYLLENVPSPSPHHMTEIAERLRRGGVSI